MRRHLLSFTSMATLLLVAATGCAANPMSEEAIQRTVEDVIAANMAVETTTFDIVMEVTVDVHGAAETEQTSVRGNGSGFIDSANETMHLVMTMTTAGPDQSPLEIPVEYFLVDGWMYVSASLPGEEGQWMKMQMPEGMWEQQNQVQQQIDLLKGADEVNYLGIEEVDGVKCYVVEIVPDMDSVRQMMAQMQGQIPSMGNLDLGALALEEMVKRVSMTQYVAVDGYLFMRTDEHMLIELTPSMLGMPDEAFDLMVEDISVTLVFGNHNEPATIQLPQGALAATQIGA